MQDLRVPLRPFVEVDPIRQLDFIVSHPLHFFILIGSSLREFGYELWRQTIEVFSWLNLPAPTWILVGVTLSLVVTVCSSDSRQLHLTATLRLVFLGLAVASFILTAMVVYLAWNRIGASRIEGWQGRYAIPLLPLLATALANEWLLRARWLGYCAPRFLDYRQRGIGHLPGKRDLVVDQARGGIASMNPGGSSERLGL